MDSIQPFVIGIWSGESKPSDVNEYLRDFVTESKELLLNGININGFNFCINIRCFPLDSPARAFIKGWFLNQKNLFKRSFLISLGLNPNLCICTSTNSGTVNFNHKFGCQNCMAQGEYFRRFRRMSFHRNPITDEERQQELRTDLNFRNRYQPEHHRTYSILEELPIDMVRAFPTSDPLHLLDLGLMKR